MPSLTHECRSTRCWGFINAWAWRRGGVRWSLATPRRMSVAPNLFALTFPLCSHMRPTKRNDVISLQLIEGKKRRWSTGLVHRPSPRRRSPSCGDLCSSSTRSSAMGSERPPPPSQAPGAAHEFEPLALWVAGELLPGQALAEVGDDAAATPRRRSRHIQANRGSYSIDGDRGGDVHPRVGYQPPDRIAAADGPNSGRLAYAAGEQMKLCSLQRQPSSLEAPGLGVGAGPQVELVGFRVLHDALPRRWVEDHLELRVFREARTCNRKQDLV